MLRTGVKSTSATGLFFRRQALALATKVARAGGAAHQVFDLFLLRAKGDRTKQTGKTTIIEVPPLLLGGFGGQNGGTAFYTPAVALSYGALVDVLFRTTGTSAPIMGDAFTMSLPLGGGRAVAGTVPAWGAYRDALNDSTGVYGTCASAGLVAVLPSLSSEFLSPMPRTLMVCRANGLMAPGVRVDEVGNPVDHARAVADGYPAVNGSPCTGKPALLSALEFGEDVLLSGEGAEQLATAGPCIEWGPLRGLVTLTAWRRPVVGQYTEELRFIHYTVTDNGDGAGDARYALAVSGIGVVSASTIPDAPMGLDALAKNTPAWRVLPAWLTTWFNTEARGALPGFISFDHGYGGLARDINCVTRLSAPNAGYDVSGDTTLALVELWQSYEQKTPVSLLLANVDGVSPPAAFDFRPKAGGKLLTYLVQVGPDAGLAYTKLDEFTDSRYETALGTTLYRWQAFAGVTTRAGGARLVCTRRAVPYTVVAADPPGSMGESGEPARRVPATGSAFVTPAQIELRVVGPGSALVPAISGYFPALGNSNVSTVDVATGGRRNFADTAFDMDAPRTGVNAPQPFCQLAPGFMLVAAHPDAQFTSTWWRLFLFAVDLDTGAWVRGVDTGLWVTYNSRIAISCVEQGTVDEGGALLDCGRVLVSVSRPTAVSTRTDGFYLFHDFTTRVWLAREPSNVAAVYAGNALVPATLGVSTNLLSAPKV